ncbi:MAG: LytTR family DNA-binding domain-containing protein [Gammaproteobacteria bacterium]|nr:LytTR family DNA-binding domain-containing protein [Gammaproteobacteria bacterium]MBU1415688.1 LytTR family DNA-binding domain-containing protein [Gammaproteobacteria bacterium]
MSLRLLIADDEPPLRDWLRRLLADVAPDAQIVAEAGDGDTALAKIDALRPDVAFLDIRMPGLSGLEVAARTRAPCRVVFVTAYDEFAVQAFEQAAADYLLKPVTAARLATTMERIGSVPAAAMQPDLLRDLLNHLDAAAKPQALRWLRVGTPDAVRLIDVDEVDCFEASDKYTMIRVGNREWPIRTPLRELEQQLDPGAFWRVHRGTLLRVAAIRQVQRDLMGRLWAELHSGGKPVAVSRRYAHLFRQM